MKPSKYFSMALGIVIIGIMVTISAIALELLWKPLTTSGTNGMIIYLAGFVILIPYVIYLFMWKCLVPLMFGE